MRIAFAVALALTAATLSGCMAYGDGTTSGTQPPGTTTGTTTTPPTTTTTTPGPGPANVRVDLMDDFFLPNATTISPGTTIDFVNMGLRNHTVTIHFVSTPANQTIKDTTLAPGEETDHLFALPGTYHVWCKFHGTMLTGMAMVVTVQA